MAATSWVRKSSKQGKKLPFSDKISTNSCKFQTEEIMNAQNFDFALTITKMGYNTKFCTLSDNFPTVKKLGGCCPSLLPLPAAITPLTKSKTANKL